MNNRIGSRDILAVLIAVAALACIVVMFNAEGRVVLPDALLQRPDQEIAEYFARNVLPSLKRYSWGIGLAMTAAAVAFILMGHENDLVTSADEETKK